MSDARSVGIIDSGIGGLAVAREISRLMPGERIVYFGDTARFPLGNRPDAAIRSCALDGAAVLLAHDVKIVVIASATLSAIACEAVELSVRDIPVIGSVLPGARAAVLRTGDRKIGVIGTCATIRRNAYQEAIERIDASVKVYGNAVPLFTPLVEEMMFDHDITRLAAQFYLYEMTDLGVDCLVVSSSYFTPLLEVIQGTVGTRMQLIDTALWTAKEVQDILTALDIRNEATSGGTAASRFLFTEDPLPSSGRVTTFYGSELPSCELYKKDRGVP